jgi:AmmeMemoRadiSam system protein B
MRRREGPWPLAQALATGFLALGVLSAAVAAAPSAAARGGAEVPPPIKTYYPGDRAMWDGIFSAAPPFDLGTAPRGAILPHHAMTAVEVGRFYAALAKMADPGLIFIFCPNHFETTVDQAVTCLRSSWSTVYGDLATDAEVAGRLASAGLAQVSEASFPIEHGIYFHAPFIKRFFPKAKIVPILLRWRCPKEKVEAIARFVSGYPKAFVLSSVDFSHYQRREAAELHDEASFLSVSGSRLDALYDREVDSPPSLLALLEVMRAWGSQSPRRLFHSNSDDIAGTREDRTTSHQGFAFYPGPPGDGRGITLLAFGDMGGLDFPSRTLWSWDRDSPPPEGEAFLSELRGEEDRFLSGEDLCLFSARSGISRYAFDGGSLAVLSAGASLDSTLGLLAEARRGSDYALVLCEGRSLEWADRSALSALADAGADLVIRRGREAFERSRRGRSVLVYSLGTFLGGGEGSRSVALGVALEPRGISLYPVPLLTQGGKPRPLPLGSGR